jgi:DNA mismatch repair protein MutS2
MKPKDIVLVKSLKKEAEILEVLGPGRYRVLIGAMQMECKEADLKPLDTKTWKKFSKQVNKSQFKMPKPENTKRASAPLDLHGVRVAEAIPMVAKKIDEAILNDVDRVEIIHGIGTGALLTAIHAFLKQQSVVKAYKLDENNPGTTWVYF